MNRRAVLLFTVVIAFAGWLVFQFAACVAPPRIGSPIPDFTLESSEGETISLATQRGKPVVIIFVASWCAVCREEMPVMVETFRAHQPHNVVFLGVDGYEMLSKPSSSIVLKTHQTSAIQKNDTPFCVLENTSLAHSVQQRITIK